MMELDVGAAGVLAATSLGGERRGVLTQADAPAVPEHVTEDMARFLGYALGTLRSLDVHVEDLTHVRGAGELNVTLYLPTHDRAVRDKVLMLLHDFEVAYAHTVTVSPSILYSEEYEAD